jgi:MOSC domain-containing protein YiiM
MEPPSSIARRDNHGDEFKNPSRPAVDADKSRGSRQAVPVERCAPMKILSLNVGLPRTVWWKDRKVTTGIFKEPVQGVVALRRLNLDGDRQADLEVHGGPWKAVYAYPSEHYQFWAHELPGMELPWGMFGENLTTEGLLEESVHIGDQFRIGTSLLMVTQPRLPCYKLGLKFGRDDILKRFLESNRSGIYFSVVEEGMINAGDSIEPLHAEPHRIRVADVNRAYVNARENVLVMRRALRVKALPSGFRSYFQEQLASLGEAL